MAEFKIIPGDATNPIGNDKKIIAHVCNDIGGWGRGFVLALSKKWNYPQLLYKKWFNEGVYNDKPFALGNTQFINVDENIIVANMIAQRDIYTINNIPPIRYSALKSCLNQVVDMIHIDNQHEYSIHIPYLMGCALAGGNWDMVEKMLIDIVDIHDINITAYNFHSL